VPCKGEGLHGSQCRESPASHEARYARHVGPLNGAAQEAGNAAAGGLKRGGSGSGESAAGSVCSSPSRSPPSLAMGRLRVRRGRGHFSASQWRAQGRKGGRQLGEREREGGAG